MDDFLTWLRAEWDRVGGFALVGLGALALLLGYRGVSNSPYVAEELAYIVSGGLGGLFMLGAGATLLISADLRDEWRKLDRIEELLRSYAGEGGREGEAGRGRGDGVRTSSAVRESKAGERGPGERLEELAAAARAVDPGQRGPDLVQLRRVAGLTIAGLLAGAAVVLVGWERTAGTADPSPAFRGTAIAVVGILVAGATIVGSTLWLRRLVSSQKARLFGSIVFAHMSAEAGRALAAPEQVATNGDEVLVARGLTRYHLSGCPSLRGVEARKVERRSLRKGLEPCGICDAR